MVQGEPEWAGTACQSPEANNKNYQKAAVFKKNDNSSSYINFSGE